MSRPHPQGLIAFPSEIRTEIFKLYFGSIELSQENAESNPLLLALHKSDVVVYEEALVCYYGFAPVIACGKWTPFDERFPDAPCQWVEMEERALDLSPEVMGVVKHLQIDHWFVFIYPFQSTIFCLTYIVFF